MDKPDTLDVSSGQTLTPKPLAVKPHTPNGPSQVEPQELGLVFCSEVQDLEAELSVLVDSEATPLALKPYKP